jgi:hypothetical protein
MVLAGGRALCDVGNTEIVIMNVNSVCNKSFFLESFFLSRKTDPITVICESHIKPEMSDAIFTPKTRSKFQIFRADRKIWNKGGVAVLVPKHIPTSVRFNSLNCDDVLTFELLVIDVTLNSGVARLSCTYLPPDGNSQQLIETLQPFLDCPHKGIILGDLNLPGINWQNGTAASVAEREFMEFAITNGFVQVVDEPTRQQNILDIALTNTDLLVC